MRRRHFLATTALFLLERRRRPRLHDLRAVALGAERRQSAAAREARPLGVLHRRRGAGRSKPSPTASSRPIRRRPAARMSGCAVFHRPPARRPYGRQDGHLHPAAVQQGTKNQGRSRKTARRSNTARRSPRSIGCRKRQIRRQGVRRSGRRATRTRCSKASKAASSKLDGVPTARRSSSWSVKDVQMGFFADPIYGGNRDMVAWKMIGFPGRPLRLSRLGRPPQRALSAAAGQHRPAARIGRRKHAEAERWRASFPKKDVVIIGLGWTGSILAQRADRRRARRRRDRARAVARHADRFSAELRCRTSCATASATSCSCGPTRLTFTFRNKMDQTALPIRTWGAFMPPNGVGGGGVHWNAETWRFLPTDFVLKTHLTAALRRDVPARGHDDPGLGRHLRRARAALRRVRISVRHVGHRRQPARARSRRAAIRSRGRARAPIRRRRRSSRSATRCSPRRRASSATSRFRSRPAICRRPTPTRSASAGPVHLLRLLRMVRLRQLFQGEPADDDPAGAGAQVEFRGARQFAR